MIQTERIHIRLLQPGDWQSMQQIAADFRRSPYAVYDMPMPTEEHKIKALTKTFADTQMFFAVILHNIMIGYICFHEKNGDYDLGFCFHSAHHGKGYAYESCFAAMEYITKKKNINSFTAGTALKNIPSRKLLEKLGFVLVNTETVSFSKDENGNDICFEGGRFIKK